jgi:hypothetical protein
MVERGFAIQWLCNAMMADRYATVLLAPSTNDIDNKRARMTTMSAHAVIRRKRCTSQLRSASPLREPSG